jgi:aspartyl-tRNA(Asn)/glutamyl-tRNA(Gln) amidotransferase subunit A
MSDGIETLGVAALLDAYRRGRLDPPAVVEGLLARAQEDGARLGAFTVLCEQRALAEAQVSAERWRAGRPRPLEGVPFAAKDIFDTAGVVTAYGSAHHQGHVPERDAAVVATLRAAGAILLGKTTTHEYAWGITTVNEHAGTARNPWDPTRIAGGSSGGSAVAVAIGAVPFSLGTDTAGSIRIPATFCGVTGFKPSYDLLPRDGVFPLAPSLDHVGLFARSPSDVRLVLDCLLAHDQEAQPARFGAADPVAPTVAPAIAALPNAVQTLPWPDGDAAFETFAPLQRAEALRVHRERGLFPARASEYGTDVRGRLELAERGTLEDHVEAGERREALRARCLALFAEVDLMLLPVASAAPPRIDELDAQADADLRDAVLPNTVIETLAGLPSCTVRTGSFPEGTPMALQVVGRPFADRTVLRAAGWLQDLLS